MYVYIYICIYMMMMMMSNLITWVTGALELIKLKVLSLGKPTTHVSDRRTDGSEAVHHVQTALSNPLNPKP